MKVINLTQKKTLAEHAEVADSPLTRMVGLLNRPSLPSGEALIITRCNSIHMFFMRFAIDVVFIDGLNRVVGVVSNIKPFRLSPIFWSAKQAIELPAGVINQSKTGLGDQIQIL